jgi:fatty acid desaturase
VFQLHHHGDTNDISTSDDDQEEDRRKFLAISKKRFAAVTPFRITVLLSTSLATYRLQMAASAIVRATVG